MRPEEFAAWWLIIRDILFAITGLGVIVYYAAFHDAGLGPEPRWPYIVSAGLLASPVFLRKAEKSRSESPPEKEPAP